MKKIYLLPFLLSTLIGTSFAANNPALDNINANVQDVLAPFQNNTTIAKLQFDNIKMNKDRALKVSFNSHAQKIGPNNIVDLKIKNLEYNYNNGINPRILFSGSFGFDFTKVETTLEIHEQIKNSVKEILDITKQLPANSPYGDALTINNTISAIEKDDNGNNIGFTAIISAKIDFNKLPKDISKEDVEFKNMTFALSVNAKSSSEVHGYININPEHYYFQNSQQELKEILESLIDNDQQLMMALSLVATKLDESATNLLNKNLINKNLVQQLVKSGLLRNH